MDFNCLDRIPRPYFEDDAVTIYHGDCTQIAPLLGRFDLLLTDPPYGINVTKMNLGGGAAGRLKSSDWDASTPSVSLLRSLIEMSDRSIIWGGNYFDLWPSRNFFVWDKGPSVRGMSFADCEIAWCSWDGAPKIFTYSATLKADCAYKEHRTQKPEKVIRLCLAAVQDAMTIFDPFAGSGTTGRAAKDMGKRAVLIEREERYCEIAAKRLAQQVLAL